MRKTRLLNEQKKAKIRALEGTMSIREIANQLHHSWTTVKKVLEEGKVPHHHLDAPIDAPDPYPLPDGAHRNNKRKPLTENERAHICAMSKTMSISAIREVTGRSWEFIKKIVDERKGVALIDNTVALANEALAATWKDPLHDAVSSFRQQVFEINPGIRIININVPDGTATVEMVTLTTIKLNGGLL